MTSKTPFVLKNREINAVFQVGFKHGAMGRYYRLQHLAWLLLSKPKFLKFPADRTEPADRWWHFAAGCQN